MNHVSPLENLRVACPSYLSLRKLWGSQKYDYLSVDPLLELDLNSLKAGNINSPCITWVIDIRSKSFVYLSKNIKELLGYEVSEFLNREIHCFNKVIHPEDSLVIWKNILNVWMYLVCLSHEQRIKFKYANTYRILTADGQVLYVWEQNSVFQTDRSGNVTHLMGVCSDVTLLLNKRSKFIPESYYNPLDAIPPVSKSERERLLSTRELQIISLLADGLNSKEISEKLSISFHTVNTHRQKIILKTNSKSTAGAIRYTIEKRLI